MKNIESTYIDKSKWSKGPWQNEPDKLQYTDEETGMPCLIVRHPRAGHLCGYVGVGKSHPYYQKSYDDIDVEVWWGLTYSDFCVESDKEHGICHIAEPGEEEPLWWLGFDCAHCDDFSPGRNFDEYGYTSYGTYRTVDFVKVENHRLALQLKSVQ